MGKTIDSVEDGIVIGNAQDFNEEDQLNKVIMGPSGIDAPKGPVQKHTIVKPKNQTHEERMSKRQVIDAAKMFPDEKKQSVENMKTDMEEKILDEIFEGENSPFVQAIERKVGEMDNWMEQKREEQELEKLEREDEEELESYENDSVANKNVDSEDSDEEEFVEDNLGDYEMDSIDIEGEIGLDKDIEEENKEEYEVEDVINEEEPAEEVAEEEVVKEEPAPSKEEKKEEKKEEVDESIVGVDLDIDEKEQVDDIDMSTNEEDEEEENTDEDSEDELTDEQKEEFKSEIIEKLKPSFKDINVSNFTVVKKPNTKLNSHMAGIKSKVIKWVLYNAESCFFMKQFDGSDMESLREYLNSSNPSRELILQAYRIIYDHIVGQKPATFDAWMKATSIADIPHYFFGVYVACFKDANYLPRDCTNESCKNHFISDNIKIMDMVKFKNEAAKNKFMGIYTDEKQNVATTSAHYGAIRTPISDKLAADLCLPSIYRSIETDYVTGNKAFIEKYANTIGICRFVDEMYEIDQENNQLIRIEYKIYEGNPAKTFRSKIVKYHKVLSTLNTDEYRYLVGLIEKLNETVQDDITYRIPEMTCPKCGSTIEAVENAGAEFLVFFRSQLAALASRL